MSCLKDLEWPKLLTKNSNNPKMISRNVSVRVLFLVALTSLLFSSCFRGKRDRGWEYAPNMYESVPYNPDSPDPVGKLGTSSQVPVSGTIPTAGTYVPFNYANSLDGYEAAGKEMKNPFEATPANIAQGKQLFIGYCSHCHGYTGQGDGAVALDQAAVKPPSYSNGNSSRSGPGQMKNLTDGKIYHTITYGVNNMGPHASQLNPEERWKIVLYVHRLQQREP